MQLRTSAALIVLLAASLAGCAQLEDFKVSAPAWESGYSWSYDTQTEFLEGDELGDGPEEYPQTFRVLRHTDLVEGRPFYMVEEFQGDDDRAWSQLMAVDAVDLSSHWVMDQVIYDCDGPPACTDDLDLQQASDAWPFPALHFPLTDGKTWSQTVDDVFVLHAEVLGSEDAVTAAGTFDAIHVRYSAAIEETESWDEQEEQFDIRLTWDLYYSEQARAVVLDELRGVGTIVETDHDAGVSETHQLDVRTHRELTGYSLVAAPQMTRDELWDHFDGEHFVSRHLRIHANALPGAGTGSATVGFESMAYGLDGESIDWAITDGAGDVVATGTGQSFVAEVPFGGAYWVSAEALRNGSVLASDAYAFSLDEEGRAVISCGTVLAGMGEGCPDQAVDVKPMAHRIRVDATPEGFLPADGHVELIAPDGTVIVDDKADVMPGDEGVWQVRYVLEQGVEVDVELEWQVLYSAGPMH